MPKDYEVWDTDPVHQIEPDGQWYFWDETWTERYGPFESRERASEECQEYAHKLDVKEKD